MCIFDNSCTLVKLSLVILVLCLINKMTEYCNLTCNIITWYLLPIPFFRQVHPVLAHLMPINMIKIQLAMIDVQHCENVTIFQQGGQDQPFPAGGLGGAVRPQRGPGQSPGGKRIFTTIF